MRNMNVVTGILNHAIDADMQVWGLMTVIILSECI